MALIVFASSVSVHAAIISDNSERRIVVRQSNSDSSNAYITPSNNVANQRPGVTMLNGTKSNGGNSSGGDSMQSLIAQKQRDFNIDASISIEESKRVSINRRHALLLLASDRHQSVLIKTKHTS